MSLISYERECRPLTKKKKQLFKDSNRVIEYETLLLPTRAGSILTMKLKFRK